MNFIWWHQFQLYICVGKAQHWLEKAQESCKCNNITFYQLVEWVRQCRRKTKNKNKITKQKINTQYSSTVIILVFGWSASHIMPSDAHLLCALFVCLSNGISIHHSTFVCDCAAACMWALMCIKMHRKAQIETGSNGEIAVFAFVF